MSVVSVWRLKRGDINYNLEIGCQILYSRWIVSSKIGHLAADRSCPINVFHYHFYSLSTFLPHPTAPSSGITMSGNLALLLYLNDSHTELKMIVLFDFGKP